MNDFSDWQFGVATYLSLCRFAVQPLQRFIHGIEHLHFGVLDILTVDFHHARQTENMRLARNESATRIEGEDDDALRGLWPRLPISRTSTPGGVDQLVEARVEIGISEQSLLVLS